MKNINLQAKSGDLIAIIGEVGCGKTTLLTGMMHELETLGGSVRSRGTVAYVEQEPFIVSGTVKENILLGSEYDDERFWKTIEI